MNLSQIEYFLAVAEKLNFTAAAQALFVSQPALSKQIRMMEEELGVRLFARNKRNVALTEAGAAFKGDLEVVLQDLNSAIENVKSMACKQIDQVTFACFQGPAADDLIYNISEKLKKALPHTAVVFQRGSLKAIREALQTDAVDIILTIDFELPELHAYRHKTVYREKAALVFSEKSPLAQQDPLRVADFAAHPLLLETPKMSEGAYRNAKTIMKALGIQEPEIEVYESWETMITYLKMGRGYCVMFENACSKINGLRQFLIPHIESNRNIVAVWKNDSIAIDSVIHNL